MLRIIELDIEPALSADTGVFEIAWVEYPAIEQELIYFGKQQFYKAPQNVSDVACRAIRENEERGNPAATQVGKVRGQQLCSRSEISLETIKRMKSYLERAATYNTGNYDDNGTISYDLWGGKLGLDWVDRILKGIEKEEDFVSPRSGENQDDFISRCVSYVMDEGKDQDQALAICINTAEQNFSGDRVGFDWGVLKTQRGFDLFKNEMRRGSLPVIFVQGLPPKDLIEFTNKYRIPISAINMYSSDSEKLNLINVMGLKRHYDLDFDIRREIPNVAVNFDYDISALPAYDSYPESGDTESMLIKPILKPVLFDEDCGCNKKEEFEIVGYIDGHPVFKTIEEAEEKAKELGCEGHHSHIGEDGEEVYMPCEIHPEKYSFSDEDLEVIRILDELKKTDTFQFEAVRNQLARGLTREDVLAQNHKNKTTYYQYKRVLDGEPHRDFCMSIEGRFFRISQIYALEDYNTEFGHNRQPYSKFNYKGGPNCVHAWSEFTAQGKSFTEQGLVAGKPGTPPKSMPNNGYYNEETKRKSEIAYIISQQNMSKLTDDLQPYGMSDDLPIYKEKMTAEDASYALGCGGIISEIVLEGEKYFQACSGGMSKAEMQKQIFKGVEEKRLIYTPLMIPNILIPRYDDATGERYFVKFTTDVIEKIQNRFMAEMRLRDTNLEHTNVKFQDVVMVESWIVGGQKDKAYELGFTEQQIPVGTWMGGYKILETEQGDEVWNKYIKTGKVKGASVEGNFLLNFSREDMDVYLIEQVINILKNTE